MVQLLVHTTINIAKCTEKVAISGNIMGTVRRGTSRYISMIQVGQIIRTLYPAVRLLLSLTCWESLMLNYLLDKSATTKKQKSTTTSMDIMIPKRCSTLEETYKPACSVRYSKYLVYMDTENTHKMRSLGWYVIHYSRMSALPLSYWGSSAGWVKIILPKQGKQLYGHPLAMCYSITWLRSPHLARAW